MQKKHTNRKRRTRRLRHHVKRLGVPRLCVFRSSQHIYAQVFSANGAEVLMSASSLEPDIRKLIKGSCGNVAAAAIVGKSIGERAVKAGVKAVAFDRSGFKYHGRVKALADAARESGMEF